MSKKEKTPPAPKIPEPAEDSIALRLVVFAMSAVCIGVSCFFVNTTPLAIALYVFLLFSGSFLSYQHRHEKNKWLHYVSIIGCLIVGGNFINDLLNPFSSGQFELLTPFVHQVAGTFVCHSFELRSRNDLNFSSAIGLALLCLSAPVAKSLAFGVCVVSYVCLGAIMLYFDCLSRTGQMWLTKPISVAISASRSQRLYSRATGGNIVLTLCLVPALTFSLFLFIPRLDNLIDLWIAHLQNWHAEQVQIPQPQMPIGPHKPYAYETHKEIPLGKAPQDRKAFSKPHNQDEFNLPPSFKKLVKPAPQTKPKPEKKAKKLEKPEAEKKPPAGSKHKSGKEKPGEGDPKQNDDEGKPGDEKEKSGDDKHKTGDDKHKPGDDKHKAGADKQKPGDGKSTDKKNDGAQSGDGGKGASGKSGEKSGKGPAGRARSAAGAGDANSLYNPNSDQLTLDTNAHNNPNNAVILRVTSNRTVYTKQCTYDTFDGIIWSNSIKPGTQLDELSKPIKGPYDLTHLLALAKLYPGIDLAQSYDAVQDIGKIVPSAPIPQQLNLDAPNVTIDAYGTVRSSIDIKKGKHFQVVSKIPVYDLPSMRLVYPFESAKEEAIRKEKARYLQLPESFSQQIAARADAITKDQGNWFVQSELLKHWLKTSFKYKICEPNPNVVNTTNDFLFNRKQGDCVDFATAFVMMARSVGIPSRIVRGFAPGKLNEFTGIREITTHDAHSWAEIYFDDYGWVPFDATPQGYLPAAVKENSYDIKNVSQKVKELAGVKAVDANSSEATNNGSTPGKPRTAWDWFSLGAAAVGALLVAGLVAKALMALLKRWRDQMKLITPEMRLYRQVLQDLKPFKLARHPGDTAEDMKKQFRTIARERLKIGAPVNANLPTTLDRFLDSYTECYFGQKPKLDELRTLTAEIHKLARMK